jgi:hypothetical protein
VPQKKTIASRQATAYWDVTIWQTLPTTVRWLQLERNRSLTGIATRYKARHIGVNATIILQSAACIEGFLVECLQLFAGSRLHPIDSFPRRLEHNYLSRVSNAAFRDLCHLFEVATGKSIREAINDDYLFESIETLFTFRNRIAHANSVTYESYDAATVHLRQFELHGQYAAVERYLKARKIISGTANMFHDTIAGHFASLVQPFIEKFLTIIPKEHQKTMNIHVTTAYVEMPVLVKEYSSKT